MANRDNLNISYPMAAGCIESWDEMERVWRHTFKKLRVNPADAVGVVITEAPFTYKRHREWIT